MHENKNMQHMSINNNILYIQYNIYIYIYIYIYKYYTLNLILSI